MENQSPIVPLTPEPKENSLEKENKKSINFEFSNQNYLLEIGKDKNGNYMTIILKTMDYVFNKTYKANYSFESLKKLNDYFKNYSNDEIIEFLERTFYSDFINYDFDFQDNILIIKIEIIRDKYIKFELFKEEEKIKQNDVIEKMEKMNKTMKEMKNDFLEIIKNLENENKILKNKINLMEKYSNLKSKKHFNSEIFSQLFY